MQFDEILHSDLYPVFVRVECETPTSGFMEYKTCMKIGDGCLHRHWLFTSVYFC